MMALLKVMILRHLSPGIVPNGSIMVFVRIVFSFIFLESFFTKEENLNTCYIVAVTIIVAIA